MPPVTRRSGLLDKNSRARSHPATPRRRPHARVGPSAAPANRRPAKAGNSPCILLVDDTELFLHSTADLLRKEGYDCVCASTASEAIAKLRTGTYDLLIADIKMPGNSHLELLHELQSLVPSMPVILVTAYPTVATAVGALRLSVFDYLIKPFEFAELRERVASVLTKGRVLRSAEDVRHFMTHWSDALGRFQEVMSESGVGAHRTGAPRSTARRNGIAAPERPAAGAPGFSPRESEIIDALAGGERVAAIARTFSISTHTVRNHLKSIYRKLGVHSQIELLGHLRARAST